MIYTGLLAVALTSCSGLLDLNPHSAVSPDAVTSKDLPALQRGMYSRVMNAPGDESYILFDIIGANFVNSSGNSTEKDMINSVLSPLNGIVSTNWNGNFHALYQVNNVLEVLESMPDTDQARVMRGEAHFFRAHIYYNLVTRWGDVPIMRRNTLEKVKRNPKEEVWSFIKEDIEMALSFLSGSSTYYKVSAAAAQALKARVALMTGQKETAAKIADELIDGGTYALDSFEKIFRKQDNREVIFGFENRNEESAIYISTLFYTYAHPEKGSYVYRPSAEVMALFEDGDKRKAISIDTYSGNDVINKYPSGQTSSDPIILYRLAEQYLISAEAKGLAGGGLARLNELRVARGVPALQGIQTEEEFLNAVLLERRRELLAEGFRYYDMVRTGKGSEIGLLPFQVLLPIPGKELLINENLTPNPGY